MSKFRIVPHGRLQEWVAVEKGYFADEGLDYEFVPSHGPNATVNPSVDSSEGAPMEGAPMEIKRGAFESMEDGRACEISSACHWAVGMAASAAHGRMWGHAYSVTPSAIWVAPESPWQNPEDLAGVAVAVGWRSGSHFSALQALQSVLTADRINLQFVGGPRDRLQLALDRRVEAANVFGAPGYVLEQQGFRKVMDTSFMIGFLINGDATDDQLWAYFNALQRAQREIDAAKEQYQHYFLEELPEQYHPLFDYRKAGTGERMVFEPYTREMFDRTHRWMLDWQIFPESQAGNVAYEAAVLVS